MADDDPAAVSSSAGDDGDDEGTDTDASNSDHAAPQHPPPFPPDAASAQPPPPAPEPTGAIPPPPPPPPQPQGGGGAAVAAAEDSRRLFQRLWTDEEELLILSGFLDFTARRGTTFASHQYDTGPFYEEIRRRLSFDFTKNQLIEKLRRLKKKYRVCAARMAAQGAAFSFRSSHERAIYDLARHIWRPAFKRDGAAGGDASDEDDINPAAAAAAATAGAAAPLPAATEDGGAPAATPRGRGGRRVRRRTAQELEAPALPAAPSLMSNDMAQGSLVVAVENLAPPIAPPSPAIAAPLPAPVAPSATGEEAARSILSPLLKELISSITVAGQTGLGLGLGMGLNNIAGADILGIGFGVAGPNPALGVPGDEKWKQQQILELEVYLKRIELIREQVAAVLEELRSS
ncbi:hypothetical protein ACP4OV_008794 [Aristida adscensionis]